MARKFARIRVGSCLLSLLTMSARPAVSAPAHALEYITQWGSYGSGNGQFLDATALSVDTEGNVYVADTYNNRVQKFTSDGTYITQWGSQGTGSGQFNHPSAIAADAMGNVYVSDRGNLRIQKFTSNGVYRSQWRMDSDSYPGALATDTAGTVYVACPCDGFPRILKFTDAGIRVGDVFAAGFQTEPQAIAIDAAGNVFETDGATEILKFASNGILLTKWGSLGGGNGQFNGIGGLAVDSKSDVYASDLSSDRIQKFTSDGTYVTQWGSLGSGDGQFSDPRGIAVDLADNVYVFDTVNHRIQKFKFGRLPAPTMWSRRRTFKRYFP